MRDLSLSTLVMGSAFMCLAIPNAYAKTECSSATITINVSANGDDKADGKTQPVATLHRATDRDFNTQRPDILSINRVIVKHLDVVNVAWLGLGNSRGSILAVRVPIATDCARNCFSESFPVAGGAHRFPVRVDRGKKNLPSRLQKFGIEHQLQLAGRFPIGFPVLRLQRFEVCHELGIGENCRKLFRWVRRCAWCGVGAERTLPPSTAPEYPLDHCCLATFNEADDLHLATAARAYQRIDFVDSLDQFGPRGHRTGTGAVGSHLPPTFVNEAGRSLEGRRC